MFDFFQSLSILYMLVHALIISVILIVPRVSMKKYILYTGIFMGALVAANTVLMFACGIHVIAKYVLLTMSVPSFVYYFIISRHRDGRVVFAFCFGDMLTTALGALCGALCVLAGRNEWVLLVGRILVMPAAEFLIVKFLRKFYIRAAGEDRSGWWHIAVVTTLFYILIMTTASRPKPLIERPEDMPIFFLLVAVMAATYAVLFNTIANQLRLIRYERTEKLMELQIHSFEKTVRTMERNERKLRIIRHDLRHYENTLRTLVRGGDIGEVAKFLDGVAVASGMETPEKYCDSAALNSVLSFYIDTARDAGIDVQTKILFSKPLPVQDVELCVVFANAVENAINACRKIGDETKRRIRITGFDRPQFAVEVANTYADAVHLDENGVPVSRKKNHGYGTQSILAFAEKYRAFLDYDIDGEWFRVRLMMGGGVTGSAPQI